MIENRNCEFKGTGGQYFPVVFIHLFLISTVTFGIYSPWAWARLLRLKASHTVINKQSVVFTGTGLQLFKLILINGILTVITFGIYGPWAICKFFDWRAQNTLVGGNPSQFTGTGKALFLFYLIHFVILTILTLGIYSFYALFRLWAWKEEHTKYGGEKASFGAGFGEFLKISIISWILNSITLILFMPWSLCMMYRWQINGLRVGDGKEVKHFPPVKTNITVIAIFIIIGLLPLVALSFCVKRQYEELSREANKHNQIRRMKTKALIKGQAVKFPIKKKPSAVVAPKPSEKTKEEEPRTLDYDQEIKKLSDLIKQHFRNVDAHYNRALLYESKGDLQQALKDYTLAVKINDKYGDAYYNRGLVYVRMKKYKLALGDFDSAVKLDHRAFDAYCNRGNINYILGKADLAIKDYTEALKINHNDADSYYNRGVVYLSKGHISKAMSDFKMAAQMGHVKAKDQLK